PLHRAHGHPQQFADLERRDFAPLGGVVAGLFRQPEIALAGFRNADRELRTGWCPRLWRSRRLARDTPASPAADTGLENLPRASSGTRCGDSHPDRTINGVNLN